MRKAPPFEEFDLRFVFLVLAILQIFSYVVVEGGDVGRRDCRRLRIVLRLFAERIECGPGKARVEAAGGEIAFVLQILGEFSAIDSQVGFLDVCNRKAGIFVKLGGDSMALVRGKGRAGAKRQRVIVHGEVLDLGEQWPRVRDEGPGSLW